MASCATSPIRHQQTANLISLVPCARRAGPPQVSASTTSADRSDRPLAPVPGLRRRAPAPATARSASAPTCCSRNGMVQDGCPVRRRLQRERAPRRHRAPAGGRLRRCAAPIIAHCTGRDYSPPQRLPAARLTQGRADAARGAGARGSPPAGRDLTRRPRSSPASCSTARGHAGHRQRAVRDPARLRHRRPRSRRVPHRLARIAWSATPSCARASCDRRPGALAGGAARRLAAVDARDLRGQGDLDAPSSQRMPNRIAQNGATASGESMRDGS